jgi:signal transduction histidine kinase
VIALARPATVRARLTVLGTAVVALMLLVSAVALVVVQQWAMLTGIDETLRQRMDNLQTGVASARPGSVLVGEGDREDSFVQLLAADGTVLAATANLAGAAPVGAPLRSGSPDRLQTLGRVPISSHDFRVLARSVPADPAGRTLLAGKNVDDMGEALRILTGSLSVLIPAVVAILALLLWWLTGRALRPVEAIRAEVAGLGGDELDRRVPVPATDDEIARLARTMNAMLDRLERSSLQQHQFVSDVSHELRTPLTRLRAELELALTDAGEDDDDHRRRCRALLEDTAELQALVDDLLQLARAEAGPPAGAQPVDLDDLLLAEARRLRERATVLVDASAVGPARVRGTPGELAMVVRNLVANAERHAAGTVFLACHEQNGHSELVVADDGPGVAPEFRRLVFERFFRLDDARSRDAGGSGLGLALVKQIVTRHGGSVEIGTSAAGGAQVTVELPRSP